MKSSIFFGNALQNYNQFLDTLQLISYDFDVLYMRELIKNASIKNGLNYKKVMLHYLRQKNKPVEFTLLDCFILDNLKRGVKY